MINHRDHERKEKVARLIDRWVLRSGLIQRAVAERVGLEDYQFQSIYKRLDRALRTDPDIDIKILKLFTSFSTDRCATVEEVWEFVSLVNLPGTRYEDVHAMLADIARRGNHPSPGQDKAPEPISLEGDRPSLEISLSTSPEKIRREYLDKPITVLGRLDALGQKEIEREGFGYIHLELNSVSRRHARIVCRGKNEYWLENLQAKYGTGLYEKSLDQLGGEFKLRNKVTFRFPGVDSVEHFRITFKEPTTTISPVDIINLHPRERMVNIFDNNIVLLEEEYVLFEYVYHHRNRICGYDELGTFMGGYIPEDMTSNEFIDRLTNSLGNTISNSSFGFKLIQLVPNIGVRIFL